MESDCVFEHSLFFFVNNMSKIIRYSSFPLRFFKTDKVVAKVADGFHWDRARESLGELGKAVETVEAERQINYHVVEIESE